MVEFADNRRFPGAPGPFPRDWHDRHAAPVDPVERAAWIATNVRGARPLLPGVEIRAPRTDPRQARLALELKREGA
jgi:hypothetical protein